MQYDNFANGPNLSNGFFRDGAANIAFTHTLTGQPSGLFWDVTANERDSHWAFDILGVNQAIVVTPEPATILLLGLGLIGALGLRRRSEEEE